MYAGLASARRRWFAGHPDRRRRLERPVISVGNLSLGGSGKTPLVRLLAEWLVQQGERPAILSRGYRRRSQDDGVVVVSDGGTVCADVLHAGDEPLMLARAVPGAVVCVCDDRHLAGALAERQLAATVHLLDDGFQHMRLARDLDVLVSYPGEITSGRVVPFGRLREAPAAAAHADFLVVMDADQDAARSEAWALGVSQHAAARRRLTMTAALDQLRGKPVMAVAGIGRPQQFFAMLRDARLDLAETMIYRDHHWYTARDLERISQAVQRVGAAAVVTTEKDAVRFELFGALPFALETAVLAIDVDGWDRLTASVTVAMERCRARLSESLPQTSEHVRPR